ncbi:MAG: hypothetical protein WKF97_13085 [Chitinophagaceae bacterium]
MIDDSNKEDLIEQYLLGELSGVLLKEFNEKLGSDNQFKNEVATQSEIIQNIKLAGRKQWSLKLGALHEKIDEGITEAEGEALVNSNVFSLRNVYRKRYSLVAAAVIGLILTSGLLFTVLNDKPDSERIFQAYHKPYIDLEQGTRGLPSDTLTERRQAFQAYNQKNYQESITLFESMLAKKEDETILFYLGNAYLSGDRARDAENTFKKYLGRYKEYAAESTWYLSLSYLKQGKLKEARYVLEEVARDNNEYSKQAIQILDKW